MPHPVFKGPRARPLRPFFYEEPFTFRRHFHRLCADSNKREAQLRVRNLSMAKLHVYYLLEWTFVFGAQGYCLDRPGDD